MRVNIQDICVTDEMVCNFVDGKTTPEEDRMILAKMKIDPDFACEVRDLMDAMNVISELKPDEVLTKKEYPFAAAAFATFTKLDNNEDYPFLIQSTKSSDDLVDNFLDQYEEDEGDSGSEAHK